jgi:hypothetical protein
VTDRIKTPPQRQNRLIGSAKLGNSRCPGGFADMLTASAHTGGAAALVAVANQQLVQSGYQIPVVRN